MGSENDMFLDRKHSLFELYVPIVYSLVTPIGYRQLTIITILLLQQQIKYISKHYTIIMIYFIL